MSDLLDVKQVQQRLRVSERTVFNLIKKGELKGFKAGREWRFTIRKAEEERAGQKPDAA